jgi:hypothetical protein
MAEDFGYALVVKGHYRFFGDIELRIEHFSGAHVKTFESVNEFAQFIIESMNKQSILSEADLEILEDLTADECFYEKKIMRSLHEKILKLLEAIREAH